MRAAGALAVGLALIAPAGAEAAGWSRAATLSPRGAGLGTPAVAVNAAGEGVVASAGGGIASPRDGARGAGARAAVRQAAGARARARRRRGDRARRHRRGGVDRARRRAEGRGAAARRALRRGAQARGLRRRAAGGGRGERRGGGHVARPPPRLHARDGGVRHRRRLRRAGAARHRVVRLSGRARVRRQRRPRDGVVGPVGAGVRADVDGQGDPPRARRQPRRGAGARLRLRLRRAAGALGGGRHLPVVDRQQRAGERHARADADRDRAGGRIASTRRPRRSRRTRARSARGWPRWATRC